MRNDDTTICSVARERAARCGSPRAGLGRPAVGTAGRAGFTIIELLIVVFIIAILIGLIVVAVRVGTGGASLQAQRVALAGMGQSVRQFEQTFGFLPPLVQDGLQGAGGGAMDVEAAVVDRAGTRALGTPLQVVPGNDFLRMVVTYNPAHEPNRRFLEGLDPTSNGRPTDLELIARYNPDNQAWLVANQRYSKYSLGYYLAGALPASVDGVDGPGMVRPLQDGTFEGTLANSATPLETLGRSTARDRFEPFFDADSRTATLTREYFSLAEYRENAGDPELDGPSNPTTETDWRHIAITDSEGVAYRYYTWRPLSPSYGIDVTATYQLNIPWILLDDAAMNALVGATNHAEAAPIDLTDGDAELRGARWAIVGAGPDGLFGTEPIETLRTGLGLSTAELDEWELRAAAKADNLVEVGR